MNNVIQKHLLIISPEYRQRYIEDITGYFKRKEWVDETRHPKYQTAPVLFERKEPHWEFLKDRVKEIFKKATGLSAKSLRSWGYGNYPGDPSNIFLFTTKGWHTHGGEDKISAVYYLEMDDLNDGTMFDMGDHIIIPKVDLNYLYVFPSNLLHRSSIWNHETSEKGRVLIAIDGYF